MNAYAATEYNSIVNLARTVTRGDFNGLYLDCMDQSLPKTGDVDKDYWEYDGLKIWDKGCRIKYKNTLWYFSFMGRSEDDYRFRERGDKDDKVMNELTQD